MIVAVHSPSWDVNMGSSTDGNYGDMPVDSIDFSTMTHYISFSAAMASDGSSIRWNNLVTSRRKPLNDRVHAAGKPVLLCIGGSGSDGYFGTSMSPANRATTINTVLAAVRTYGYDGIDWDWEPFGGSDSANLFPTIRALYDSFQTMQATYDPTRHPIQTADINPGGGSGQANMWKQVAPYLEFVMLMSYDKMGSWTQMVYFDYAPYSRINNVIVDRMPGGGQEMATAQRQALQMTEAGFPAGKVVVGIDFMAGRASGGSGTWAGGATWPRQEWSFAPSFAADYKFDTFYEDFLDTASAAIKHWDDTAKAYFLSIDKPGSADDRFISYAGGPGQDSTLYYHVKLAGELDIGGIMIWDLSETYLGTGRFPQSSYPNLERNWLTNQMRKHIGNIEPPPPPPPPDVPKIKGKVFFDGNQNRILDAGEPPMAGWTVNLTGPVTAEKLSDSSGSFSFEALPLGEYTVSMTSKTDWTQTYPVTPVNHAVSIDTVDQAVDVNFGAYSSLAFHFPAVRNWNIISMPVSSFDMSTSALFPLHITPAYSFHGQYHNEDSLTPGEGYWIKFNQSHEVWVAGSRSLLDTVDVVAGWNFIGSIAEAISVGDIRTVPAILLSPYIYGYDGGSYLANQIEPGKGYWVHALTAGMVIISNTGLNAVAGSTVPLPDSNLNELIFISSAGERQSLYFTLNGNESRSFPAPPSPPEAGFEARFRSASAPSGGSMVEILPSSASSSASLPIMFSNAGYPMAIEWKIVPGNQGGTLSAGNVWSISLEGNGRIDGYDPGVSGAEAATLFLRKSAGNGTSYPSAYRLEQNYPNPFNGSSVINFTIVDESRVRLEVYNVLGEKMLTLVDRQLSPGLHSASLRGDDLPSGIFLYRLTADLPNGGKQIATKKLVHLK
ncbi:MAG TPA: glycosyl hydrolase family 18 protein [Bacteroidota bacterium]|nr:glycosyl hydrolase family 18 protein [Bacteroidota bacterium]